MVGVSEIVTATLKSTAISVVGLTTGRKYQKSLIIFCWIFREKKRIRLFYFKILDFKIKIEMI
jgi:hypothetical protein